MKNKFIISNLISWEMMKFYTYQKIMIMLSQTNGVTMKKMKNRKFVSNQIQKNNRKYITRIDKK